MTVLLFTLSKIQKPKVTEDCFRFSYGFERMDRKNQLASISNITMGLNLLNNRISTMKSADIGSNHLNTEYLEQEVPTDRKPKELPIGNIVTSPMTCIGTSPHTVTSSNNEWTSIFFLQEIIGGYCNQMSIISMYLLMFQNLVRTVMIQITIYCHHIYGLLMLDSVILFYLFISFEI